MVQTKEARDIDLRYLVDRFNIQLIEDEQIFPEWRDNLLEITDIDKMLLDKVRSGFINLLKLLIILQNKVGTIVLNLILFIADFYLAPFYLKSEQPIDIAVEDDGVIIRGRIDTLV